jgi:hypothetical protein
MLKPLLIFSLVILLSPPLAQAPDSPKSIVCRHIIGLEGINRDTNGIMFIERGEIHFDAGKQRTTLPISSIEDIFIGTELTQAGGKMGEVAKGAAMAAPYDSGAALTLLLQEKVDVLTIAFCDSNHGLHAAIFALPKNRAKPFRDDLVAHGAKPASDSAGLRGEKLVMRDATIGPPTPLKPAPPASIHHMPVLIEPLGGDVKVPAEFRFATYEFLVDQVTNSKVFSQVYRNGDTRAKTAPGLFTLTTDVDKFKQGNQTERELVTVMGATKISVTVTLIQPAAPLLMTFKVDGTVRFFGENLGVALDLAKRIAKLLAANP